ncbi:MAG TPA: ABC transporter substrate-binding protein [bacterium]|nr:ABC transporter substrate-binding protein [bacterium]
MRTTLSRRQVLAVAGGAAVAKWLGAGTPVRAQGITSLQVGMAFHNLDAVCAWIAQDRGYFRRFGLDVTIISIQGGSKTMAAMAGGDVPLALSAGSDVITAGSRGVPVTLVAGLIDKFPYDFVVAKNITTSAQLKGSKGAISGFGGSSHFAVLYALQKLGVDPSVVTLLQVGNETARLAALQSGQIQFTVLTAGLDLEAFDMGYKPMLKLYTSEQPYQHTGIAVNTNWAKTHGPTLDAFMKGIVMGSVYVKDPITAAAAQALIHKHLPIKDDNLRKGLALYRQNLYQTYPLVTVPGMEFILRQKKIEKPVTQFYDNSYIQALQGANFAETAKKSL